jgi:hypothetical protein
MQMSSGRSDATTSSSPGGVRRTVVATNSHDEADLAVDRRMTTGRAIGIGAAQGACVGLFLALLLFYSLFFELSSGGCLGVLSAGIVAGAVLGALWGGLLRRRRLETG